MNDLDAINRARYYLKRAGTPWVEPLTVHNFQAFCHAAADAVRHGMSAQERARVPDLIEWAERFRAVNDDFEQKIKADPLIAYEPRTEKHARFHESTAFVRYLLAANTIGKTLMAFVEDIWCTTGQRHYNGVRGNVVVVSTGHTVYSEQVFVRKMINGEDGDPLSPYLPEGGKWLHSFDQRKYLLRIACPECAEKGKTRDCSHTRAIQCLSADSGVERLMGFTARLAHIDEHIDGAVYRELRQRVRRGNANGRIMVTATPLAGPDAWEIKELYNLWKKRPEDNWLDAQTKQERFVEVFSISKYDCIGAPGGPTLGQIEAEKATMPPSEFRARIMGEPVPLSDSPVFDLGVLDKIEKEEAREAEVGNLYLHEKVTADTVEYAEELMWQPDKASPEKQYEGLHVWEHPQSGCAYAIGVDVASGIGTSSHDASCAYVAKLKPELDGSLGLEVVACHYSFLDVYQYAIECKKLAIYYNQALIIPEVVGIGAALMTVLYRQLCYPAVFQGENAAEMASAGPESHLGVRTSAQIKPLMIAALQKYLHSRHMTLPDKEAISECRTFEQTRSESGLSYRYSAASGAHDDRVMALALVCYACLSSPDQVNALALSPTTKPKEEIQEGVATLSWTKKRPKGFII